MASFPLSIFSPTSPTPTTTRASGGTGPAEQATAVNAEITAIETALGVGMANVDVGGAAAAALTSANTFTTAAVLAESNRAEAAEGLIVVPARIFAALNFR